jgi:hypothetical protein
MPKPASTCPVRADDYRDHDDRGAHVLLEHQQREHAGKHRGDGQQPLLEVPDRRGVAVHPAGDEHGECELAELRGLKGAERTGVEPAPGSVDSHAQVGHEDQDHQQHDRDRTGGRERAQAPVVDAAEHEQRGKTDEHPDRLALGIVERGLMLCVGEGDARAGHHHKAGAA